jgi:hypothetical protein
MITGRHVLGCDGERLDDRVEAIRRRRCGDDRHRALAVAAVHHLEQVGLFGLRRQPGARPAALHVDDDDGQFGHDRQADRFRLERDAGAGRSVHPSAPPKLAPMAAPIAAISSSAWNVTTP